MINSQNNFSILNFRNFSGVKVNLVVTFKRKKLKMNSSFKKKPGKTKNNLGIMEAFDKIDFVFLV